MVALNSDNIPQYRVLQSTSNDGGQFIFYNKTVMDK